MYRVLIAVSYFVFASANAALPKYSIVMEGLDVKEGDFKYNAAIYYIGEHSLNPYPVCGGAVLNEWYILTSAQSLYRHVRSLDELVVHFGATNISSVKQTRLIAEIKYPNEPNYKFNAGECHYDVALVRVKAKIDFSDTVQPIALPENADVFGGTLVTCGFDSAMKEFEGRCPRMYLDQLHYHNTSVIPMEECEKQYPKLPYYVPYNVITFEDMICTVDNDGFVWNVGYGGNPLVANNIIYGLALDYRGSTKLFTKVFSHKKWIEDNSAVSRA